MHHLAQRYLDLDLTQRWRNGHDKYVPSDSRVETRWFAVERICPTDAKRFVVQHHYSRSFVYDIASYGLIATDLRACGYAGLVGVAVFATASNSRSVTKYTGYQYAEGAELGRFVLLDEPQANAESWFLARAMKMFKQEHPERKVVLSYSDPHTRRTLDGRIICPGHVGTIYQASNALYVGRGAKKKLYLDPHGRSFASRNFSKIRNQEAGHERCLSNLERATQTVRSSGESYAGFVERARRKLRPLSHPGNHLYLFPLAADRREKRQITKRIRTLHPKNTYPKKHGYYTK